MRDSLIAKLSVAGEQKKLKSAPGSQADDLASKQLTRDDRRGE